LHPPGAWDAQLEGFHGLLSLGNDARGVGGEQDCLSKGPAKACWATFLGGDVTVKDGVHQAPTGSWGASPAPGCQLAGQGDRVYQCVEAWGALEKGC
jgi:hypothetical protein